MARRVLLQMGLVRLRGRIKDGGNLQIREQRFAFDMLSVMFGHWFQPRRPLIEML